MKESLKLIFIPMIGAAAMALIFLLVVWAGSWYDEVVNEEGRLTGHAATRDLNLYPVLGPGDECADVYFPVCGFDGTTYDNACEALRAGTKVAHRGACA